MKKMLEASLVNAVIAADKMSLESMILRYVKSMKQVKKAAAEAKKESSALTSTLILYYGQLLTD